MAGAGIHAYQQQWPAAIVPAPPATVTGAVSTHFNPVPVVAENPNSPGGDELRTIFITGLPEDVKERELQNLLRWLPGYEASQVNFKGEHPMGFALFSSYQFAVAAKDVLQDMLFDSESTSVLHTEMAKKNLFVKRGIVADPNFHDQSKRMRVGSDYTQNVYSTTFHHPAPIWAPHGYVAPPYDPYSGYHVTPIPLAAAAALPLPAPTSHVIVQNTKDNPPCNTLFVGNLGEFVNENELKGFFSTQPGYKQMKVLRQERHTVCFIEFDDVSSATYVHHNLQGALISSSGSVGMRIQYSKNPFGKRKDGSQAGALSPGSNGAL